MKPRRKCEICGNPVEPDLVKYRKQTGKSILCKACVAKEQQAQKEARIADKQAIFAKKRCIVCGQPLQWKPLYAKKSIHFWPTTCSPRCHGIAAKRECKLTKEQVEHRIEVFLQQLGHPCTYVDVIHGCHVASKVVTKLGISILDIQKRVFGLQVERVHVPALQSSCEPITLLDINRKYTMDCNTFADVAAALDARRTKQLAIDKQLVEDIMKAYICTCKHFVNKTAIYHEVFKSRDFYWPIIKTIDSVGINRLFGYSDPKRSWFELKAAAVLHEMLGTTEISAEHTFADCRSEKNFPLRFDFYIPELKLLLEIDGAQHADKENGFYKETTVINDQIKDRYAQEHGYRLLRIPTTPRFTFVNRLHSALLDVIKPVELLEPLTAQAEGNQQPSSECV